MINYFDITCAPGQCRAAESKAVRDMVSRTMNSQSLTLLLIDDNQVSRKVTTQMLKNQGHQCRTASTPTLAMDLLRRESFDAILLDAHTPKINGTLAAAHIRSMVIGKRVPLVVLCEHAVTDKNELCIQTGADDCLSKPFTLHELQIFLQALTNLYNPHSGLAADSGSNLNEVFRKVQSDLPFFRRLAFLFEETAASLMKEIHSAIAADDCESLRRSAHALKGTIAVFQYVGPFETACWLEKLPPDEMPDKAASAADRLETELIALSAALHAFILSASMSDREE